ncbi:MAG: hypothetical protein BM556_15950 [Bacteriovorax sp. MedPE-SWde]|nr:MAG: hypothetical protein BM556_15950 [Bacteriovorax sp. MedPE-SWde]
MTNTEEVDFYFDFTSPYSYLAWETLLRDESLVLNPIPVMVGKLISEAGSIGPGEVKPKREYLFKDCLRKASESDIVLRAPKSLPFNPMGVLRLAIAAEQDRELQRKVITAVFRYGWREGSDFENYEGLRDFICKECDISVDQYSELDNEKSARKGLKSNIKQAVELGIFGVPTFKVGAETFWGLDSLRFVKEEVSQTSKNIELEFNRFVKILEGEKDA